MIANKSKVSGGSVVGPSDISIENKIADEMYKLHLAGLLDLSKIAILIAEDAIEAVMESVRLLL